MHPLILRPSKSTLNQAVKRGKVKQIYRLLDLCVNALRVGKGKTAARMWIAVLERKDASMEASALIWSDFLTFNWHRWLSIKIGLVSYIPLRSAPAATNASAWKAFRATPVRLT